MAAKGNYLKQEIMKKILQTFPDSFLYNDGKEIRINGTEDGNSLQIKVTFTCAKEAVSNDATVAPVTQQENQVTSNEITEPSAEEKERLKLLLDKIGL